MVSCKRRCVVSTGAAFDGNCHLSDALVEGYHLSNFRLGFRSDDGLTLFAWVRNAFDENYFEQLFVGPGNTGLIAGLPGDPHTWGATASITF